MTPELKAEVLTELRRVRALLRVVNPSISLREAIGAGDEVIEALGLNPWCIAEGADPNGRVYMDLWKTSEMINKLEQE